MPRQVTEAQTEEFRARLCAVAERRFAELGVDGVSMRQLAQEMGCSATTLYRYFRDKDEILAAVRTLAFDRFSDALEAASRGAGDARARATAVGEAYIRFAFENPNAYRMMFDLYQPEEERYPELVRAHARSSRNMSAYVEALVEEGVLIGDPRMLGVVFWAAIHGLVVLRLAGTLPRDTNFDAVRREMMQLISAGARTLGASRAAKARKHAVQ